MNFVKFSRTLFYRTPSYDKLPPNIKGISENKRRTEPVVRRCSVKKVFLEISQNSQENTWAEVCNFIKKETLAQVFSSEFCEISKNNFFCRTPLVVASERNGVLSI